ncbi:MAG: PP2C family serine/threonine-protein phosphatase [Gemmatimonadaceae bacterium]
MTDVGQSREHNEDAFLVAELDAAQEVEFDASSAVPRALVAGSHGLLFLVADGMGGAASGELASSMAREAILESLQAHWDGKASLNAESFATVLRDATEEANSRIHQHSREYAEHRGMGTTSTLAGLLGDRLYLAQVGDSRAYMIRNAKAIQITKDQSLMQRLVEAGELTAEEAENSDRRNIILQALGPDSHVTVDLTFQQVRRGDTLIICSDGLSGLIRGDEIAKLATEIRDVEALCHKLVDRANEEGGHDNITVIAAHFEGNGLLPAADGDEIGHRPFPLAGTLAAEEAAIPRTRPTPFKSDPTPMFGLPSVNRATIEEEFARARDAENDARSGTDEEVLEERRKKAQPIMFALIMLAVIATIFMVWRTFFAKP